MTNFLFKSINSFCLQELPEKWEANYSLFDVLSLFAPTAIFGNIRCGRSTKTPDFFTHEKYNVFALKRVDWLKEVLLPCYA